MKHLITSGCSFSETHSSYINTWPRHLNRMLPEYTLTNRAMSSQGNGLISRGIIYEVNEKLKTNNAEDLLVGVVWSGPSRHDYYVDSPKQFKGKNLDGWIDNPTDVVPGVKQWAILNHHWKHDSSKMWYRNFYSHIGSYINTLEHILRTQWFLEKHNIKYFMSTYTAQVLPGELNDDLSTAHLYGQIDFTKFLPISGILEWSMESDWKAGDTLPSFQDAHVDGQHPTTEHHKLLTEKVILPFVAPL